MNKKRLVMINTHLYAEDLQDAEDTARRLGLSRSELIRRAITQFVAQQSGGTAKTPADAR